MSEIFRVGMADLKVCKSPDGVTTIGLGSCVGVAIRDPLTKVGGLVHIMLPDSTLIENNVNKAKFADTGIEELVKKIIAFGGSKYSLEAKIAGGAQMFSFQNKTDLVRIGDRNVEACKKKLKEMGIPIKAAETGENFGRTVVFYPQTGEFIIRSAGKPEKTI